MILEVKDLVKEYKRGNGQSFNAVDHVDFSMEEGDYVTIIGRSGSGKSTFLNMLSGMITPTFGSVKIDGKEISSKTDKEISFLRNDLVGFIPQGTATMPNLTILDNIVLPFFLYKRDGDAYGKARFLMDKLGINDLADAYPKNLSGGELRRVLIARALMNDPKILIADEPTSDLDIENTKEVMEMIKKVNDDGVTVILVSHEMDTLQYGKRTFTMVGGKLVEGKQM